MPANHEPKWLVFMTCVLTHVPMFYSIVIMHRSNMPFEAALMCFAILVSVLYHTCDCYNSTLFLNGIQWHRLDNIGAITTIIFLHIHLSCIENEMVEKYLKYFCFFLVIILQEGHPWDERYTIVPILLSILIPVYHHVYLKKRGRGLYVKKMMIGLTAFVVAGFFFVLGLDDNNDPARLFHGLFHVFISITAYSFVLSRRMMHVRKVHVERILSNV